MVAITATMPSMKKIAPLTAGRMAGSLPPMHWSHARAAHGQREASTKAVRAEKYRFHAHRIKLRDLRMNHAP